MYDMVGTRPNFVHVISVVSISLSNFCKSHWDFVKRIFRFLDTSKLCLCFGDSKSILEGFLDADMARNLDGRKSTPTYLFTFRTGVYYESRIFYSQRWQTYALDEKVCFRIGFE